MNNDIIPPKRIPPPPPEPSLSNVKTAPLPPPVADNDISTVKHSEMLLHALKLAGGILLVLLLAVGAFYIDASRPVAQNNSTKMRIEIPSGSSPVNIASILKQHALIKSELIFEVYARIHGSNPQFKAGTYSLSQSESLSELVDQLTSGHEDTVTLTFYPGATLTDHSSTPMKKKTDVETVLLKAGYSQAEISAAFAKSYPEYADTLFATKPASADLEGYVFGETYNFDSSATAEQVLTRTFDELETKIKEDNLVAGFQKQGLSLYQGITLASVIQREVSSPMDRRQVAQIFLLRLKQGKSLGSDVTYQYAARKLGVAPSPTLASPYNTRIHAGLPPGPISSPGLSALQAVANPAPGNYLFFLSGDDGKTYFAHTNDEHEANIRDHCKIKCAIN
jgi:UPF0755 protein